MDKIEKIARDADIIINGYAFSFEKEIIRVISLDDLNSAIVLDLQGEVLETSMDDIEIAIVKKYYKQCENYKKIYSA